MEDFYSSALVQIAELKTVKPELKEILEFYESTLNAQKRVQSSFQSDLSVFDNDLFRGRNSKGLPLLRTEDIKIDPQLLDKILRDICQILRKKKKEAIPATFDSSSLAEQHRLLIEGLMEDGSILERLAGDFKINYTIFYFLINQALSPFIANYAEKLGETTDSSNWLRGYCPSCGREPLIGRLEEETGRKWLFCSLCHTEWLFKRLVCPFCENDDQESLRYFFAEDDEAHRIDVCDKCKRYIKTIDSRRMDNIRNLFVETLSALALDIVADKEGFRGGDISLFSTEQA